MSPWWDRAVVISLRRRPDRLQAFLTRWAAIGAGPVEVFAAVDRPDNPAGGCYESHLAVLRTAAPGRALLVLEDDAVFTPAFGPALPAPPPGWRLARLGGFPPAAAAPAGPASPAGGPAGVGVWRPVSYITRTHAYLAADPPALAAGITARDTTDISAALAFGWAGHYRHTPDLAGQTPNDSDITPPEKEGP